MWAVGLLPLKFIIGQFTLISKFTAHYVTIETGKRKFVMSYSCRAETTQFTGMTSSLM